VNTTTYNDVHAKQEGELNEKIENKTCGNNEKDTVPLIMG
jgi:hypothetical protein